MEKITFRYLEIAALGAVLLAMTACANTPFKTYAGPALPAEQTAVVGSGPYTDLVAVDGTRVSSLSVAVLPGTHAIEMKPVDNIDYGYQGPYYFWSLVTGSVKFTAEPGHKYQVYVHIAPAPYSEELTGSGYTWTGYVEDRTVDKKVGWTERLPLQVEPRNYSTGSGMMLQ